MDDFGGVPLLSQAGATAGAVLLLGSELEESAAVQLQSGIEIVAVPDTRAVVVRGLSASSYESVMTSARESANQALDILALAGGSRIALADSNSVHVAWWADGGVSTVMVVDTSILTMSLSATGVAVDASGNQVVQPAPAPLPWHESMRYFRTSQTSADLFDAFRNTYLALESILSTIEPVQLNNKGKPEGERVWIERALRTAEGRVNLASYLSQPSSDAVTDVLDELYVRIRTSIFHAKNGRPVLLPQDSAHRAEVADALSRYVSLYLDLAADVLGVRFPSGGMTAAGFDGMVSAVFDDLTIHVTNDPSPARKDDAAIAPAGGVSLALPTSRRQDWDGPLFAALGAKAPAGEVAARLGSVRRFGGVLQDGRLAQVGALEAPLTIDGFDQFECVIATRGVNARQPKSVYEV